MSFCTLLFALLPVAVWSYSAGSPLTANDCPACSSEITVCESDEFPANPVLECSNLNELMVDVTASHCLPVSESGTNFTLDYFADFWCMIAVENGANCSSNGFYDFYNCAIENNCLYSFPSNGTSDMDDPCQLSELACANCDSEQILCQSDTQCLSVVSYVLNSTDCISDCTFGTYFGYIGYDSYYDCLSTEECLPSFGQTEDTCCDCNTEFAACQNDTGCKRIFDVELLSIYFCFVTNAFASGSYFCLYFKQ